MKSETVNIKHIFVCQFQMT